MKQNMFFSNKKILIITTVICMYSVFSLIECIILKQEVISYNLVTYFAYYDKAQM